MLQLKTVPAPRNGFLKNDREVLLLVKIISCYQVHPLLISRL